MVHSAKVHEAIIAEFEVVDRYEKFITKKNRGKRQWTSQEKAKHSRKNARKNKILFY